MCAYVSLEKQRAANFVFAKLRASYMGKHRSNIVTDVTRDRVHPLGIVINASRKRAARNLLNPLIPIGAFQTANIF